MNQGKINPEIVKLAEWLNIQCSRHAYGSFGIMLTMHNGHIKKVERHAVETLKPDNGDRYDRRI